MIKIDCGFKLGQALIAGVEMLVAVLFDGGEIFLKLVEIDQELIGENLNGLAGNGQYLVAKAGANIVDSLAQVVEGFSKVALG